MIETVTLFGALALIGAMFLLVAAIYVAPLLPYIVIVLAGVLIERTGQLWTDMYLTSDDRAARLEELEERHENGDRRVTVTLVLGRVKRVLYEVAEWYADVVRPAYSRLPLV